jgi:thioredoxin reductase (NADPH)
MAWVLCGYLIALVPFGVLLIIRRAFFAFQDTRTPFVFSFVQAALAALGAVSRGRRVARLLPLAFLAAAVAFTQSLSTYVQLPVALRLLRRHTDTTALRPTWRALGRFAVAAVPAFAAGGPCSCCSGDRRVDRVRPPARAIGGAIVGAASLLVYIAALACAARARDRGPPRAPHPRPLTTRRRGMPRGYHGFTHWSPHEVTASERGRARATGHHHRFRPGGIHRRHLRGAREPLPARRELGRGRWRAHEHHRGRELPRLPRGHHGPDLMAKMQEQAEKFGTEVVYDDVVSSTSRATSRRSRSAAAPCTRPSRDLRDGLRPRKIGIEGEQRLSGHGVSYCATCDGFFFREQQIAVVGGGDSAMEEATFLTKFASKVYVIHRRDELRASKIMQERAFANEKIEFVWNSEVVDVLGGDAVTGLLLRDTVDGSTRELPVTGVFVAIGNDPRTHLVHDSAAPDRARHHLGRRPLLAHLGAGVFAAGDVVDPTYRQAVTAAASGTTAALDVEHYLAARGDAGLPRRMPRRSTASRRRLTDPCVRRREHPGIPRFHTGAERTAAHNEGDRHDRQGHEREHLAAGRHRR